MSAEVMLTIAITAVIQSIFGAGVLLFGTPILLLFGFPFVDVLIILLPVSLGINLMQTFKHHSHIDFRFYRKILGLTLPSIALFLFLITHVRFNIGLVIGSFLILIALKEFSTKARQYIDRLMHYETIYLIVMGIVHGVSNLGGSMLTAIVHYKNYEKDVTRVTIAVCYGTFALVQLLTLSLFDQQQINIPIYDNVIYFAIGAMIFGLTDATIYTQIDREKYTQIFAGFLAISGVMLIFKSLSE